MKILKKLDTFNIDKKSYINILHIIEFKKGDNSRILQ